jgi:hypothetical protein
MSDAFASAPDVLLDDIVLELDFLQPDEETTLRSKYSRIHPAVAAAMARGASQRQILELLKQKGLDLHHATLTKLFKAELAACDESGARMCCVTCGQSLKPKESAHADATTHEADAIDTSKEGAA